MWTQALSILVLQPAIALVLVLWGAVLWPAWVPYVLWIPRLGPALAGRAARAALHATTGDPAQRTARSGAPDDSAASVLTGRIEHLTLLRAAGYASGLSPDTALLAYGASAVMTAAMGGVAKLLRRVAERRGSGSAAAATPALTPAEGGPAAPPAPLRSELVVRRYLLGQLQAAEEARAAANRRRWRKGAQAAAASTAAGPGAQQSAPRPMMLGIVADALARSRAAGPPPPASAPPTAPAATGGAH